MTDSPLQAPVIDPARPPKGPASYFPSIERTYEQPMQHWIDLVAARFDAGDTHGVIVTWLKDTHALGHGHANAIVAWVKAHRFAA